MMDSREAIAKHFFMIMNKGRFDGRGGINCGTGEYHRSDPARSLDNYWYWLKFNGFHQGYLRLADETVSKGYKP